MAVRTIVTDEKELKKVCKVVKSVTDETRVLVADMIETMKENNGVGLAAIQVGVAEQIIVVLNSDDEVEVYLNPRISKKSIESLEREEGCLSFPGLCGRVIRSCHVDVTACDMNMKRVKVSAEGLKARIFQHEIDHLNGIVFTHRANKESLKMGDGEEMAEHKKIVQERKKLEADSDMIQSLRDSGVIVYEIPKTY